MYMHYSTVIRGKERLVFLNVFIPHPYPNTLEFSSSLSYLRMTVYGLRLIPY